MNTVGVYFITDGREGLLEQTLRSFHDKVSYPFVDKLIVNDCVEPSFKKSVDNLANFYGLRVIHHEEKRGFAGVYDTAWKNLFDADYYFGVEDDFVFNEKINIQELVFILQYNRNLAQVCLKRQAWNEEEMKAGGIIEQWPDLYEQNVVGSVKWCEHRLFYSTNPNLTPRHIVLKGWPLAPKSESVFSQQLFRNPNIKCAYFGGKFDKPSVTHIGNVRVGINY